MKSPDILPILAEWRVLRHGEMVPAVLALKGPWGGRHAMRAAP
jgi:hypothetical protein